MLAKFMVCWAIALPATATAQKANRLKILKISFPLEIPESKIEVGRSLGLRRALSPVQPACPPNRRASVNRRRTRRERGERKEALYSAASHMSRKGGYVIGRQDKQLRGHRHRAGTRHRQRKPAAIGHALPARDLRTVRHRVPHPVAMVTLRAAGHFALIAIGPRESGEQRRCNREREQQRDANAEPREQQALVKGRNHRGRIRNQLRRSGSWISSAGNRGTQNVPQPQSPMRIAYAREGGPRLRKLRMAALEPRTVD